MEKIAVIGVSCLFPGAKNSSEYWQNLLAGKNFKTAATRQQMGVDPKAYYSPTKGVADRYYCMQGGYIHDFEFDSTGYHLPPEYLEQLDDLFKWSLYVARDALTDSGYLGKREKLAQCGIILGNLSFPTKSSNQLCIPICHKAVEASLRKYPANADFQLAPFTAPRQVAADNLMTSGYPSAVIARALSLYGPYFCLDAACASSIYAVKLACDYLSTGRADMMLAGAVSAADPLFINMGFSIFQAYPTDGKSHPFDKKSRGLIAGEGAGMFVLKRFEDAVRDGDNIYASILGVGLSNDGRGQSVLAPGMDGQNVAYERAYAKAGIDPKNIAYVECHATGTLRGDKVELDSMDTFFGKHGASPLVGSCKSNLGHLLTAAGMAGMLKTILSMSHGIIPATIDLKEATSSKNNVISANQIPVVNTPWPGAKDVKHAAVNGFGFGGANAHIIFESHQNRPDGPAPEQSPSTAGTRVIRLFKDKKDQDCSPCALAITGMDALFGPCRGLSEFRRTTCDGLQHFIDLPEKRWKGVERYSNILKQYGFADGLAPRGAYVDRFDLDFLGFKIPPNKDDRLIPQQLIVLKVADKAIRDAEIEEGSHVAVLVAMGAEPSLHQFRARVNLDTQMESSIQKANLAYADSAGKPLAENIKDSLHSVARTNQYTSFIGNIMASRIASVWDFSGPAFTVSSEENSVFKALDVARMLLADGDVDAVVLAAVDLAGGFEQVLLKNNRSKVNTGRPTLSFDRDVNGWQVGEGAGAVVLKRRADALAHKNRIYATVNALGFATGDDEKAVARACRNTFECTGIRPSEIAYLEVHASGIKAEDQAEISGLVAAYQAAGSQPSCAIGSVKANIGHTFAAAGMAGLIKTALCLYHRYIPPTPGWSAPKYSKKWDQSPFFVPTESRTWFVDGTGKTRVAAINSMGADHSCCHMILSDEPGQTGPRGGYLASLPMTIFPLAAGSHRELELELDSLATALDTDQKLATTAEKFFMRFKDRETFQFRMSIVGKNRNAIYDEIENAKAGLQQAFQENGDWLSENGSCFTCKPLGETGKIAFVYPGGFNSYIGLGHSLCQLFPEVHERAGTYTSSLGEIIDHDLLSPKSMSTLSENELKELSEKLFNTPSVMFESGIMSAILCTDIIRESFGVKPDQALGYSMGEISMLFALGVWDKADQIRKAFNESSVYKLRLAGSMENVRAAWNLDESEFKNKKIWYSYKLEAAPEQVRQSLEKDLAISRGRSAYLIFVNTPQEVVIAGYDQACKRVIKDLGCNYFEVPVSDAIHSELVRPDYEALINMHRLPVNPVPDIDFYSAFDFAPIVMDSDEIARRVADIYTHEIDFQQLIEKAYQDGGRIFIELGPRNNCTRWTDEILQGQPHLAVATNEKDVDEHTTIIKVIAGLFCHKVPVDLAPLYSQSKMKSVSKRLLNKSIVLGGNAIDEQINSDQNRSLFASFGKHPVPREPDIETAAPGKAGPAASLTRSLATGANAILKTEKRFNENLSRLSTAHQAFLNNRIDGTRQIHDLIELQLAQTGEGLAVTPVSARGQDVHNTSPPAGIIDSGPNRMPAQTPAGSPDRPDAIWDHADLLEFARGSIANVFGPEYKIIDTYRRRVRLPMDPYLLVTRVTRLDAQCHRFKPSAMTTEYDIPRDFWYSVDGQIPWAVSVESGQCDLLLISYLGIDFSCRGDRVYRLLDCTLTFLEDIPMEGDTLRYDIRINSFSKSGESLLFFFSYECFVEETMVLKMDGGCAGFFTDAELDAGQGIIHTDKELETRKRIEKQSFQPFLQCAAHRFEKEDLLKITRGDLGGCLGEHYARPGFNPSLKLATEQMLMIDRIDAIDITGGTWGLGKVMACKILAPDHWYFPCHFKDDEVMAGSLMAEGCGQLLQFFLLFIGMHTQVNDARFQPIGHLPQKVRCRGQVTPQDSLLTYRMEIKEIGLTPHPHAVANIDILLKDKTGRDKIVVDFESLGVQLVEKKSDDPYKAVVPMQNTAPIPTAKKPGAPAERPLFDKYHFEHFATGSLSECFGPEFAIYAGRVAPRTPNTDLQLTSRVTRISGKRHDLSKPASAIAEYDVPEKAWYYTNNAHGAVMPYAIIMEIALQPCGFISAYMGTTLLYPETDFFFRNLDGRGKLHRDIDLRGKTIENKATLLTTAAMGNTIIQTFEFEMKVDGDLYYSGTAAFGYFVAAALTDQIGLDNGVDNHPLTEKQYLKDTAADPIDLQSVRAKKQYYASPADKPGYRLAGPQLDFLNTVQIVADGGKQGLGYIYADRKIDENDWYFKCHFYQDPVMPGSLGVEAVMQTLTVFALHQDLGQGFTSPKFTQIEDTIIWKYRGQINPEIDTMAIEVHITRIEKKADRVTLIGDAGLWKDRIRIYEIKDIGLCIEED
jgi:PfaB family protein